VNGKLFPAICLLVVALAVACSSRSTEPEQHFNAGVELGEERRFEEAILEYDETVLLDPEDALAFSNRGASYFNLGRHQLAIRDFSESIRLNPQIADSFNSRGTVYFDLGQFHHAIDDFDEAIRLSPKQALGYLKRGIA